MSTEPFGDERDADVSCTVHEEHASCLRSGTIRHSTSRARRELASWVAHDLRSPLAGLRAMAASR
jgi:nitrogen-specific signal transduction histidine kinase